MGTLDQKYIFKYFIICNNKIFIFILGSLDYFNWVQAD